MRYPSEKMTIISTHEGKSPQQGWLALDISKMDLDGVGTLYVNLDDVESLAKARRQQEDALSEAKKLLGG